jgi:hypothetical protein
MKDPKPSRYAKENLKPKKLWRKRSVRHSFLPRRQVAALRAATRFLGFVS